MLTFGRQHEKECAIRYLRNPEQSSLMQDVVDAVHDVIEDRTTIDPVRPLLSRAFIEGGAGVWEQTGSWIRRLAKEHPPLQSIWQVFACHPEWKVRFKAACFINELPLALANEIGAVLRNDRSQKVREMAQARLEEIGG